MIRSCSHGCRMADDCDGSCRPITKFQRLTFLNAKGETISEYLLADGADLLLGDGIDGWIANVRGVRLSWAHR